MPVQGWWRGKLRSRSKPKPGAAAVSAATSPRKSVDLDYPSPSPTPRPREKTRSLDSPASRHGRCGGGDLQYKLPVPVIGPEPGTPPAGPPCEEATDVAGDVDGCSSVSESSACSSSDDAPLDRVSRSVAFAKGRNMTSDTAMFLNEDKHFMSCSMPREHQKFFEAPVSNVRALHVHNDDPSTGEASCSRGRMLTEDIFGPRTRSPSPGRKTHAFTVNNSRDFGFSPRSPLKMIDGLRSPPHPLPLPPAPGACSPLPPSPIACSPLPPSPTACSPLPTSPTASSQSQSHWRKGKLLGSGTFGQVYLGFNSENGQFCAIKEVQVISDDPHSKERLKQLNQEIDMLKKASHPNVVQYYGSDMTDETLSIYLEYVSGGSIHKLLREYGPFKEPVIRNYTGQILSGLAYLHAKNTVHRDIKGANILVVPNGEVKLADFGMAKHISSFAEIRSFKGSPYWMAPEVIMNTKCYNLAVDIWSLGCTIIEMATARPPWNQYEGVAAIFKIANSKDTPEIPDIFSEEAKSFLKLCLKRDPASRATASQLMDHPFVQDHRAVRAAKSSALRNAFSAPADVKHTMKLVLKLDTNDRRQGDRALKAVASLPGIDMMSVDTKEGKMTVVGTGVDPVAVVGKLRKWFPNAIIVSVGPAKEQPEKEAGEKKVESGAPLHEFTFGFLNRITNGFSEEVIIGRGRHGVLYKGVQDNGECIVVKRLHSMRGLDNEDFKYKFNHLMRVQHQNTIRLVGYCHHTAQVPVQRNGKHVSVTVEETALCSEYLHGGSLEKHLSNEPCVLDWHICYEIIKGICEGLHYLHKGLEYPIYHLELKPTKVLLDKDMMPKIGGFGFSGLSDSIETSDTSEVMGTSVYMPPEYTSKRKITHKFDVFSLGVIILQIMAGKRGYTKPANISAEEFIESIYEFWANRMQATISKDTSCQVRTCIEIGLKCVESNRENRPTIKEIIQRLNKIDIVECSSIGQLYRTREFAFEFLERITNDFSEQNIVGCGGYGAIYKGVLENREEIVVKKLHQTMWINDEQFKNEINNLMRVQHKNIVQLIGFCHHTSPTFVEYNGKHVSASIVERAICLEYMQGGSLDNHLSAEPCRLDWKKCYIIIKGICEGLHCLHNDVAPIYHLDLKPSNILLDKDMVAKIGDFGLSRLFDSTQTYMTSSKDMKGTLGYMPPEYIDGQKIGSKFDVFSLGVIIMQIMAGKEGYYNFRDTAQKELIKLVCENWRMRMEATMWSHVSEEVRTCMEISLKCVEEDRTRRPTIAQIVNELNNIGIAQSSPIDQNEMENKASQSTEDDGEQPYSAIKAVADVLAEDTNKPKFLQHVGIQHVGVGSSASNLEAELTAEKRANAKLQEVIETLSKQVKELEEARILQDEENRNKQAEMQNLTFC